MRGFRVALFYLGILALASSGGCVWSIGGGTQRTVVEHSAGEQLAYLKRAKEAGAISPEEYDRLKRVYLSK
jgi:hypothetical protein